MKNAGVVKKSDTAIEYAGKTTRTPQNSSDGAG
jgi:hypothetical protein